MKVFIGIDNGVSGSIGVICEDGSYFYFKPTIKKVLNYQKKAKYCNRIVFPALRDLLSDYLNDTSYVMMERPMVNPGRFAASASALRAYEATLVALEEQKTIPLIETCDSKEWQKALLPEGLKGADKLKLASKEVGLRMFPKCVKLITKQKDADGLLIAEFCRRKYR